MNLIESIGQVSRGMTQSDIEKLPTKSFKPSELGGGGDSDGTEPQCNICIDEYADGDRLRILQCMHNFHAKCIDRWLKVRLMTDQIPIRAFIISTTKVIFSSAFVFLFVSRIRQKPAFTKFDVKMKDDRWAVEETH